LKSGVTHRGLWLGVTATLIFALYWLDLNRGGPASMLSRCNLLLSKEAAAPSDVLIVGSSRTGVALDPVAIQNMLKNAPEVTEPGVERIALGHNPLRLNHALLENYLTQRGAPRALVLEITFMTQRSVDRLAQRRKAIAPEHYLFRRDLNLMTFAQILQMPAVAMPYTEDESTLNLWRFRLRGVVLRAGALVYEFLRKPGESWQADSCERTDWIREPEWPDDFAFSYGDFETEATPGQAIDIIETAMAETAVERSLKDWQQPAGQSRTYPYDFDQPYRAGEVALLTSMLELAARYNVPVILLPLPLYGFEIDTEQLQAFARHAPGTSQVFDLYGQVNADLSKFWYDDGHLELRPAAALTSALLTEHLLDSGLLSAAQPGETRD